MRDGYLMLGRYGVLENKLFAPLPSRHLIAESFLITTLCELMGLFEVLTLEEEVSQIHI